MEESKSLNLLGRTSKWAAAQRARESCRADRLFEDPLAEAMAGEDGFEMLRRGDEVNPQSKKTADLLAVRTRFFDDLIFRSVSDGIRQVVILAAGLDCRVFRLDLPTETEFYELDQKPVIEMKEEVLLSQDARTKCRRVALPVDLRENWVEGLWKAGFRTAPSIWIMEGLLYYLAESSVRRLLIGISACSTPGSKLGADLVSESFFRSPLTENGLDIMRRAGIGWQFGTDDPETLLAEYGWQANAVQPGEEGANYGRWTTAIAPRSRRDLPHKFLVTAIKQ